MASDTFFLVAALTAGAAMGQDSERLKADVSYLASDELEGRGTPSKGLDLAAEFIAAQFRSAGLRPAGDDGYFQTASFVSVTPNMKGIEFTLRIGGRTLRASEISVQAAAELNLVDARAIKIVPSDTAPVDDFLALPAGEVNCKVLLVEPPAADEPIDERMTRVYGDPKVALVVMLGAAPFPGRNPQLRDASDASPPMITVTDEAIGNAVAAEPAGPLDATVSAHLEAPAVTPVKLRNVVGVLPGSDPLLKDTYVLLTAHYDHLGICGAGERDRVCHGANDDASGTASVIEIAATLGAMATRPKRSIVFMALFGEELGLLGSRYYARHPLFPLAKTIVDLNLEQLGRTDETGEGKKLGRINLTGFDFTDLAELLRPYAKRAGVKVVKDEARSDPFFLRSDNAAFAEAGVPSTSVTVTYVFSDYHQPGDEWPKLDYGNMARVDRAIALAAYGLADSIEAPRWNARNGKTEAYRKAREGLGGAGGR